MGFVAGSLLEAARLIAAGDPRVLAAVSVSIQVAGVATLICAAAGLPLGLALAVGRFRGRRLVVALLNTLMALPTVVVGLFVYAFIARQSLLGPLDLLYTKQAMVIGQVILGLPIVVALTNGAMTSLAVVVRETALTLGAGRVAAVVAMIWEGRFNLMAALAAAFGRLLGEVGVSMILGGNIAAHTRSITTALAMEVSKGAFAFAMALGVVLLVLALGVNLSLWYLQGRGRGRGGGT